jgi:1,5-anhydro-D-fructose reductase (1,5-anhydro-D-mannitol-forming)
MTAGGSIRLVLLGAWHVHAKDHAASAKANPQAELVGVWDHDRARAEAAAQRWGIPVRQGLDEVWNDPDIDGVIVATETTLHEEVIASALLARKHVFCEKALARTALAAEDLAGKADDVGVCLGVALPRIYRGYTRAFRRLLKAGFLGEVVSARIRISHDGARRTEAHPEGWLTPTFLRDTGTGGGVLIDLGAHPLYVAAHLFGEPLSVRAALGFGTGREVEDSAVVSLYYPGGMAVGCEASFLATYSFSIEIFGGLGHVAYRETLAERAYEHSLPRRWSELDLEMAEREPFDVWLEAVAAGDPFKEQATLACRLARLTEQAYAAHQTRRELPSA